LGARDYAFDPKGDGQLRPLPETGLGLLRDPERRVIRRGTDRATMTPEVRAFMMQPSPLIVTKSLEKSPVHRRVQEDYIGVKRFKAGKLVGERRFVGLFTSAAYHDNPRDIPFLRRKVATVMAQSGFPKGSHNAKALAVVLQNLPRDELFQVSEADLLRMGPALAHLGDRPDTNVFIRFDTFERFASVHVYFPADKFRGGLIRSLGGILTDALGGQIASADPHTEEGQMARIHFTVMFQDGRPKTYDHVALKARLTQAVRLWSDDFSDALARSIAPEQADAIFARYSNAFSEAYREAFGPAEAILDIGKIEEVAQAGAALALFIGRDRPQRRRDPFKELPFGRGHRTLRSVAGA
jgi:glutamate dehydrogenase